MKYSLILCEGKMDAGLLGFWLRKKLGFVEDQFPKHDPPIKLPLKKLGLDNVVFRWLSRATGQQPEVLVLGVGGFTNLLPVLSEVFKHVNITDRNSDGTLTAFERICVAWDCDEEQPDERLESLEGYLDGKCTGSPEIELGVWSTISLQQELKREVRKVSLLPVQFPKDKPGCLETSLHEALTSAGAPFSTITSSTDEHVTRLATLPYLAKLGDREKCKLGTDLAVIMPDWSMDAAYERIKTVDWTMSQPLTDMLDGLAQL